VTASRYLSPGGVDPPLDGKTPVFEEVGADPSVSPGYDRPMMSVARFGTQYYLKYGSAATNWFPVPDLGGAVAPGGGSLPPAQIDIGDAAITGTAGTMARADHQHAFPAPIGLPVSVQVGAAGTFGTATTSAPSDHSHPVASPAAPPAIAAAGAAGASTTPARSDHTHAGVSTIDATAGAFTTGSIAPSQIDIGDTVTTGTSGTMARADHQHAFPAGSTPPAIASAGALGSATTPAKSDHTHAGVASINAAVGALTFELDMVQWAADHLLDPDTADWGVNGTAALVADTNNSGFRVRQFTNVNDLEGVGFERYIPATIFGVAPTQVRFTFLGWANAAPAGARTVGLKLRTRQTANAGAPGAWSSATQLTDLSIAATRNLLVASQTISFATLGLNVSRHVQFELTRATPSGGTNLVDTFDLVKIMVELLA
jgi:hypothetical protein